MSDSDHKDRQQLSSRQHGIFQISANNEPLYQRVPSTDEEGKALSDFMMLIPKLNQAPTVILRQKMAGMQVALVNCPDVVFADLNLKLNVLWVSIRPRFGLIESLALQIQEKVPEAKLVSAQLRSR